MTLTLTIGIPAYNEGKNIKTLLESLLSQKTSLYKLERIIISSDGSNDDTVRVVKTYKNNLIRVIENHDRQGIARGLNQVIAECRSDILVTLDADIFIKDESFIDKLIEPIINEQADLTSSSISYLPGVGLISQSLQVGTDLKQVLFNCLSNPNNIYHCFGLARAFSSRLYKRMTIPTSIGNDMYTYFYCLSKRMKFRYSYHAVAWYKLPTNLKDHLSQSKRFMVSGLHMSAIFGQELVNRELNFPLISIFKGLIKSLPLILKKPLLLIMYIILQIYTRLIKHDEVRQAWTIAESSK